MPDPPPAARLSGAPALTGSPWRRAARPRHVLAALAGCVVLAGLDILLLHVDGTHGPVVLLNTAAYVVTGLGAGVSAVYGAITRLPGRERAAWICVGIVGGFTWMGDVAEYAVIPFAATAAVLLLSTSARVGRLRSLIDLVILAGAVVFTTWGVTWVVLGPSAAPQPGRQFALITAILPDVFYLLVVAAVLIGSRGQERWAIGILGFSSFAGLIGDSLGALTTIGWSASLLPVAKVFWILSEIAVIAAGSVVQPSARAREAAADRSAYRRGLIPHVCVGVMAVAGGAVLALRGSLDIVMTVSTLTVMALLAARQLVAHRENHILMRQLQDRSEELRASHLRLRHQAEHDPLTGLANRLLFHEVLRQHLERSPRGVPCGAVLFVDLDDFKNVNDTIGHGAGDAMLRAVAGRFQESLRSDDVSARLGGDEFAVLLCHASDEDAAAVARRILAALAHRIDLDGHMLSVAASIGIAMAVGGDGAGELLRRADVAMYASKSSGKGLVAFYHPNMDHNMLAAATLREELRQALSRGQLVPFFQPIVHLHTGAIVGAEALIRWRHPARGMVMPSEFIPLAEESGVIVDMGRHMLEVSAQQMARWRDAAGFPSGYVSVNVSSRHFLEGTLARDVRGVLESSGLSPGGLVIELTESALITDVARARGQLDELRSMGVRVALDDFGTGYSSLGYLRSLPVDILKIDRSFLADLHSGPQSVEFVRAIATLAQSLDVRAVAEGVEGADQLVVIRSLGIDEAQGYHFSRPLAAVAFQSLIEGGGRFDLPQDHTHGFASTAPAGASIA